MSGTDSVRNDLALNVGEFHGGEEEERGGQGPQQDAAAHGLGALLQIKERGQNEANRQVDDERAPKREAVTQAGACVHVGGQRQRDQHGAQQAGPERLFGTGQTEDLYRGQRHEQQHEAARQFHDQLDPEELQHAQVTRSEEQVHRLLVETVGDLYVEVEPLGSNNPPEPENRPPSSSALGSLNAVPGA